MRDTGTVFPLVIGGMPITHNYWRLGTNPDDMHYEILADRVRYFKEDKEEVAAMCKAMEDMRNEAILQDRKKLALQRLEENELSHEQMNITMVGGSSAQNRNVYTP